ncbi:MAG: hypothetical protein N2C14_13095, partial [Planctomycetales bacterium]
GNQLFLATSDTVNSGRCMKCHTADEDSQGQVRINWRSKRDPPDSKTFTKFTHHPHLTLLSGPGSCRQCHSLMEEDNPLLFLPEFRRGDFSLNTNPHSPATSGMAIMQKQRCKNCHNQESNKQSCLTCHDYHVTESPSPWEH